MALLFGMTASLPLQPQSLELMRVRIMGSVNRLSALQFKTNLHRE